MNFLKTLFGKKKEAVKSYEDFWNWFKKEEASFSKVVKEKGNVDKVFFSKLSPKLAELKEGFFFSTGMYDDTTVELVITADGSIKLIAFVEELINAAPKLAGWKFTALKPPLDIADVNIAMAGFEFNRNNLHFYENRLPAYPDEIDITVVHDDLTDDNREIIVNGTYIFLDNYIGELDFVTTIDNISIFSKNEATEALIPINKLKDFLTWREKEFVEKYDGLRYDTENDNYSGLEAKLENGNALIALINTDLLTWDCKASHPWILNIQIKYDGANYNGMPDERIYALMSDIEKEITDELKDFDGYLNIGRQTADNKREIYFACREFRKPSKVLLKIQQKYGESIDLDYDIYKDKYWQSFNRFTNNIE